MDVVLPTTAVTVVLASILLVGSIVVTLQKVVKNIRKEREEARAKILQAAKEEDQKIRLEMESRIDKMELQISHLKETYAAEIKVLGEKIDSLRDELRQQSSGVLDLLTKLIESKE